MCLLIPLIDAYMCVAIWLYLGMWYNLCIFVISVPYLVLLIYLLPVLPFGMPEVCLGCVGDPPLWTRTPLNSPPLGTYGHACIGFHTKVP